MTNYIAKGNGTNGFITFDSIETFAKAVATATGMEFDINSVTELNTDFIEASERFLLLNIKEYDGEAANNLLFLTRDTAYVFTQKRPSYEAAQEFADVLDKPYGKSTILAFIILDKVVDNHTLRLETLNNRIKQLEDNFSHTEYRALVLEFERFDDRLEEFHNLLLKLQERRFKEVSTQYISFDYDVLLAQSLSLQGRCRRRLNTLRELRQEHEMLATEELNQRIVKLNEVVKRLTSFTVILMLPTLIASHFGMNFAYMPELRVP